MPDARTENRFIAAIKTLWNGLLEAPGSLWVGSIFVLVIGGGLILASKVPSPFGWERHEPAELARDIGIALIIAPVVTIIYEAGTRRSAKLEEMRDYINATMASFVTKEVWQEVKNQIVFRNVARRNVLIKIRMLREVEVKGQTKTLPDTMAVLEVRYEYDLYRNTTRTGSIRVRHALDIHMWDPDLEVPCFKRIEVTEGDTSQIYEESTLIEKYNSEKGLFSVDVDPPEGQSVHIVTIRHEKIFLPGMYTLVMPEIMAAAEKATAESNTIHVTIEDLPDDIEANTTTWFAPREFVHVAQTNVWSYKWPMLAGQGFSVVFKRRVPPTTVEAIKSATDSVDVATSGGEIKPPVVAQIESTPRGEATPPPVPEKPKVD